MTLSPFPQWLKMREAGVTFPQPQAEGITHRW